MKKEHGKDVRNIGGFWSGVFHDAYESPPGVLDLRQELYRRQNGSFFLLQTWPYDFTEGRETIAEVSMWELPMILSVLEGPIGDRARALQIDEISAYCFGLGLTIDETAKRLCISPATVRRRMPILKAVLAGNLSRFSSH